MAYHIVSIDSPRVSLSCKDAQLICRDGGASNSVPLEDVGAVVITSFSASIHSHLLVEAAKHGVGFVLCDRFKPASLLLPANRCTDTVLTRAQVSLPAATRDRLWQKTVGAKCVNQLALARHLAPGHHGLEKLELVATGKHPTREAETARNYWPVFGEAIGERRFLRDREMDGANALLNYGYAVLLSVILRDLFAVGIDPTFGIFHVTRERSTPLAYDLMEPFRPWVDWRVAQWVREHRVADVGAAAIDKEFRTWMTGFTLEETRYGGREMEKRSCIEAVVRSFRRALCKNRSGEYQPWTPRNSKWVG